MNFRSPLLRRATLVVFVLSAAIAGAAIVLADPASPVTISDVDTPDPVSSGGQITHSITIVNTGGAKITNVVMSDQLNGVGGIGVPPQLQIASSRGSCAQSGTLVTCNGGQIEGNGSWTISIRGIVTAANGTVLNNTVSVTGTKSAQNFTTTNTTTTLVSNGGNLSLPELSINKTGPTTVVVGAPMTYTLTVNNTGTQNATGIRVIDTVPTGITGISASGTSLFVCAPPVGQTVTCDGGQVNQGSNATITINGFAPAVIGTLTNTAVVDPDNTIVENNELNNTSALVNTLVTAPTDAPLLGINITDVNAVITGAGPDPVVPGGLLTYKILATNDAATRADDVVIVLGTQGLEASSVMVSQVVTNGAIGTFGGCTNVAPQAKCTVRSLNPGGSILMTVSGYVIGSAGSMMIGTATVTGNIKNKGYTTTDTELTTVMPQYDLTITKADSPDPVCAASWPGKNPYPAGPGAPVGPDYPGGSTCQGGLTYTFVIGNSGIQPAAGVTVRDPLPAGTIFEPTSVVNVDGGGFACDYNVPLNVVTCTGGTIPAQSTRTLKFTVVAPPGLGQITNTVTVDPNNAIFEADESNNTFAQTTQIATGIDLTVSKHSNHEADFVATKGTLTYAIKVSNLGTQDAMNISVRDALPADSIFRDAVSDPFHGFTCSQAGGVVDCINGHIQGTESMNYPNLAGTKVDTATITIRVFATAYEQPAMHNEVRVDPLNQIGEANENNNVAVQNTQVKSGGTTNDAFNELIISKIQQSPDPTNTARNAVVTYVVKVGNDGTDPVVGVKVRDTLPAGAKYIQATGTNSFLCQPKLTGVIDCVGGQIAANTSLGSAAAATITIKAFAPDTPATYTNQVEVDPDHTIAEGNEFNNNASADTIVKNAGEGSFHELSVTKHQDTPDKTNTARNAVVTYSIVVKNLGTDAVNGVVVRDKIPAGSRYIQANGDHQFLCTEAQTGIIDCVNGQIAGGGGTALITLKMFAPDTPGEYINQVNVDPNNAIPEGDEFNNQATETTTVTNGGTGAFNDLHIEKDGPASVRPKGAITYSLKVWNTGTNAALSVAVRDVLPAGEVFVSAADAGVGPGAPFTCSQASGVVNCTGGTLNPGVAAARFITIQVTAPNAQLTLTNQAFIDPDNTIPEGDEDNNTDTKDTIVSSAIDLTVTKFGPTESSQGDVSKYTITVTNGAAQGTSGQAAFGIKLYDPLAVGLIPLAYSAPENFACSFSENPINLFECLGDLAAGASAEITVDVFMTGEGSRSLDNEACVDPADLIEESNENNNCSTTTALSESGTQKVSPDLLVVKSVNPSGPVNAGQALTYTMTISNVGTAKAAGPVTLTDTLPNNVTFVNHTATNGWTCTFTAPNLVCHETPAPTGGDGLDVGESATITINATYDGGATAPIVNHASADPATIDGGPDPDSDPIKENEQNLANNSAFAQNSVGGTGIDLVLSKVVDKPDPVATGQTLTYTAVVVNGGTEDSTTSGQEVVVRLDVPPTGLTFLSASGSNGFNCLPPNASHQIICKGDLPGGGDTTVTAKFLVMGGAPPDLLLTARVDPNGVITETDEGNNEIVETTTVAGSACPGPPCVDLVAAQISGSPDPYVSGGTVTMSFLAVNIGDTGTSLDPSTGGGEPILEFNVAGTHNPALLNYTAVGTNPASVFSCTGTVTASAILSRCYGNLGPGEGVTVTATLKNVTSPTVTANGKVDPLNKQTEFQEVSNNGPISKTVTKAP
ncbi:MAG TPA: CARDB domain-containing protein [Vicinamibacterales bacterium]|nr:CARDB domain-containing protein [Vicinamibacterales bacterium]